MKFKRDSFTWLAYLLLGYFAYYEASLSPILPYLRAEFGFSFTITGLHFSAFALGLVLGGLVGDRLAGRWGRRNLFWGGALGMGLAAIALAFSRRPELTIAWVFVLGATGSLVLVVVQAALSDRHGPRRTVALSEANLVAVICAALVPLLTGFFQQIGLGWRAALLLPAAAVGLLYLRTKQIEIPQAPPATEDTAANRALPSLFWRYWIVVVLGTSAEWSILLWSPAYLETVSGLSTTAAATGAAVYLGAMILGRMAGSRLAHHYPPQKLLLAAQSLMLAGFLVFWFAPFLGLTLTGLFIAGLGAANSYPMGLSTGVTVAPDQADLASARVSLGSGLSILLAPLFLGWLADQQGLERAFVIVGMLLIFSITMTLLANRAWRNETVAVIEK